MSLKGIADQNLSIFEEGQYLAPSGAVVSISAAQEEAEAGTRLYRPPELTELLSHAGAGSGAPTFEVTGEKTQEASRRLVVDEEVEGLALLNFASARNPGGGFIRGARAQEEDLGG
jgi:uncharacterized protein (TIGR02452 family)